MMKLWCLLFAAFVCITTSCSIVSKSQSEYMDPDELEEIRGGQEYYEDEQDYYLDDMRLTETAICSIHSQ
ncbi:hypothetical protein [Falsiporphyromonas endometrii]|uniref:Secreted protein n=1 Tax=Falsiporphyromonas endometrii TaxID=1387297 RepID=A0ABV9K9D6_9PORP